MMFSVHFHQQGRQEKKIGGERNGDRHGAEKPHLGVYLEAREREHQEAADQTHGGDPQRRADSVERIRWISIGSLHTVGGHRSQ